MKLSLGLDEKSFNRGHSIITPLTDLEQSHPVEEAEDRITEAAGKWWTSLSLEQKASVGAMVKVRQVANNAYGWKNSGEFF